MLTMLCTAPAAIAAFIIGSNDRALECGSPVAEWQWLIVAAALFVINLIAVFWFWIRCARPYTKDDPTDNDFSSRACHYLCHSKVMALYMLVLIVQVCWQVVGHVVSSSSSAAACTSDTQRMTNAVLAITWVYLTLTGTMLAITLCVESSERLCGCIAYILCCGRCGSLTMPGQAPHGHARAHGNAAAATATAPGSITIAATAGVAPALGVPQAQAGHAANYAMPAAGASTAASYYRAAGPGGLPAGPVGAVAIPMATPVVGAHAHAAAVPVARAL